MNIYVLVKRTFDTEGKIAVNGAEFIINASEYAVKEA